MWNKLPVDTVDCLDESEVLEEEAESDVFSDSEIWIEII